MHQYGAIFDMDGTLLDSMSIWDHLTPNVLRSLGYETDPGLNEIMKTLPLWDGIQYCKEHYQIREAAEELVSRVDAFVREGYCSRVETKPGLSPFLSRLRDGGVRMYVATNTDLHLVEVALEHAGIRSFFDGIVTCGEVGVGKGEGPDVYEEALRRLGTPREHTVVFEDALFAAQTAKKAGFRVVGVCDDYEPGQEALRSLAYRYIRSFEELLEPDPADTLALFS